VRTLAGLFGLAFAARFALALPFQGPAYADATYYVTVARELAAGHGFSMPYIWSFVDVGGHLPDVGLLPIPSNAHWMPLASIVQVPFIWALGPTWLASSLPFWILGALAAPVTYLIGMDAGLGRHVALPASLLMAVPGAAAPLFSQPDNFSLYLLLGATALWLCARALRGDRRAFVLGGIVVGLATLARTDGVVLAAPYLVAFAANRRRARSDGMSGTDAHGRLGWATLLAFAGLFLIVMAPWWARQLSVFGSISPSSESGRILWITSYNQQFSVADVTTPATFFAQGLGPILASRANGFVQAIVVLGGTPFLFFLVPLVLIGAWDRRRDPAFVPWISYGIVFLAACTLVFAEHVQFGLALHSGAALLPHGYLLGVRGLGVSVEWVALRRRGWDAARATRNFTAIAIGVVWLFALAATWKVTTGWGADRSMREAVLASRPVPASDRLMSPDPGAYWDGWGLEGVPTPSDPLPVIEETLRRYGVRWLIIERDHAVPALDAILRGGEKPAWLSAPLAQAPAGNPGPFASVSPGDDTVPRAVLYAVCLTDGDARCAPPT
jgi:hypothetical protein